MNENGKIRFLIFSALYPPHVGGVERFTKNVSEALYKLGHEVTVVTSAIYGDSGKLNENGVIVYRLPCFALLGGRMPIIKKDQMFRRLLLDIKQKTYDLCMINTRFYTLSLFAARFAYKNNIKSFILDHGSAHLTFGNPLLDLIENIYEHSITWVLRRYCTRFYGVSHDSEIFLRHFHIKAKGTIHNAIDVEEIERIVGDMDYDIRAKTGIPKNSIVISYVGRLIYRKGVIELNQAMSTLIKRYPDLYLLYAGDGELRSELEKQKTSHTIILGKLEYEDAIKLIKQSDIFCLATETEGFPTSVLEAAACQTFIITTLGAGGAKELIKNHDYGIVMENNYPPTIEKAIACALNEGYRNQAVHNCYLEVKNNYTWKSIAEKIIMENRNE